jgi:flagellar biosynthetic protein FliP
VRALRRTLLPLAGALCLLALMSGPALAQAQNQGDVNVDFGDLGNGDAPQQSVIIILAMTLLSVAPSLLVMLTSFTRIIIVLSITRNALGLPSIPPNQVMVGLAMFLSLFIMSPTLKAMNERALQPLLKNQISPSAAFEAGQAPLKAFMLKQTRKEELEVFIKASGSARPKNINNVSMATLARPSSSRSCGPRSSSGSSSSSRFSSSTSSSAQR